MTAASRSRTSTGTPSSSTVTASQLLSTEIASGSSKAVATRSPCDQRCVRDRVDEHAVDLHRRRGLGQHRAELSSPDDADASARHSGRRGSGCASTSAVRASRQARSRSRSSGRPCDTIAAASTPALVAPGSADRERAHGDAGGHLHDRQERIEPVERLRHHGHAEDRKDGVGSDHARQVRGAARSRDDDLDAPFLGGRLRTPAAARACDERSPPSPRRPRRGPSGRRRPLPSSPNPSATP